MVFLYVGEGASMPLQFIVSSTNALIGLWLIMEAVFHPLPRREAGPD
jgi:hypothetical protein